MRAVPDHGTRSRYMRVADPCRCDDCAEANRLYITRWRRRQGIQPKRYVPQTAHGTYARYQRGCRCDGCREANTVTRCIYRARRAKSSAAQQERRAS